MSQRISELPSPAIAPTPSPLEPRPFQTSEPEVTELPLPLQARLQRADRLGFEFGKLQILSPQPSEPRLTPQIQLSAAAGALIDGGLVGTTPSTGAAAGGLTATGTGAASGMVLVGVIAVGGTLVLGVYALGAMTSVPTGDPESWPRPNPQPGPPPQAPGQRVKLAPLPPEQDPSELPTYTPEQLGMTRAEVMEFVSQESVPGRSPTGIREDLIPMTGDLPGELAGILMEQPTPQVLGEDPVQIPGTHEAMQTPVQQPTPYIETIPLGPEAVPVPVNNGAPGSSQTEANSTAGMLPELEEIVARYPQAQPQLEQIRDPAVAETVTHIKDEVLRDPQRLGAAIQQAEVVEEVLGLRPDALTPDQDAQLEVFYNRYTSVKGNLVLSQRQDLGMPLHVDDKTGQIVPGYSSGRVSPLRDTTRQMRQTLTEAEVEILEGHPIHHKIPIQAGEKDPLVAGAIELEGYEINNAENLKQLPGSSEARSQSAESALLPEHGPQNYHPVWNRHALRTLEGKLKELKVEFGIQEDLSKKEVVEMIHEAQPGALKQAVEEVEQQLERDLIKDDEWIRYNEQGERILSMDDEQELESPLAA